MAIRRHTKSTTSIWARKMASALGCCLCLSIFQRSASGPPKPTPPFSEWTYLWVNFAVISIPFAASFDKRVAFVEQWKHFWPACLLTMAGFIAGTSRSRPRHLGLQRRPPLGTRALGAAVGGMAVFHHHTLRMRLHLRVLQKVLSPTPIWIWPSFDHDGCGCALHWLGLRILGPRVPRVDERALRRVADWRVGQVASLDGTFLVCLHRVARAIHPEQRGAHGN